MKKFLVICLLISALLPAQDGFSEKTTINNQYTSITPDLPDSQDVMLSPFPDSLQWLNALHPVNTDQLKGKFVLLNFWTASSEICLNQLNLLNELKKKHRNLEVLIVHNPKYKGENSFTYLHQAIVANAIGFPLINDPEFLIWNQYNVNAWPTNLLFGPDQQLIARSEGADINFNISSLIQGFTGPTREGGSMFSSEEQRFEQGLLAFPLFIESDGNFFLFVSDTRSNRILVSDYNGVVEQSVGNGKAGSEDGNIHTASFNQPKGLAYDETDSVLYIADTGNNLIRKYDLKNEKVSTLLGNGSLALTIPESVVMNSHGLNRPTDLVLIDDELFITMTGWNQIWKMNIKSGTAIPVAGTGRFGFSEGKALKSDLAEPYGITADALGLVYFTERQSSAIRVLNKNKVSTLIGQGVFDYGDEDGRSKVALMQGPAGIHHYDGSLFVADQHNNKIKVSEASNGRTERLIGTGEVGYSNGAAYRAELNHPSDITVLRGQLFFTDAFNHCIRIFDFESENVRTFDFLNKSQMSFQPVNRFQMFETDTAEIATGSSTLTLQLALSDEWFIDPSAPNEVIVTTREPGVIPDPNGLDATTQSITFEIENKGSFNHFFTEVSLFYRPYANEQAVYYRTFNLLIPIKLAEDAPQNQLIRFEVPSISPTEPVEAVGR